MHKQPLAIYVVKPLSGLEGGGFGEWRVERWDDHPALFPRGLVVHTVSTAAGDVELHIPYPISRESGRLAWAVSEVEKLHPKPRDMEWVEALPSTQMLLLTLNLALAYIELAEDGRGHNARSRYLAQCIRHLHYINFTEWSESDADAD